MKNAFTLIKRILLVLVVVVVATLLLGVATILMKSRKVYTFPAVVLSRPAATGNVTRGKYLVQVRHLCVECHGTDLAGGVVVEDPMAGHYYGRNITPSRLKDWTDAEIAGALRHGVGRDGRPLRFMPAEDYVNLCEKDLIDIIAYLRAVPAVEKANRHSHAGPVFYVLAATRNLPDQLYAVEHVDHTRPIPPAVREGATPEFGAYLYKSVCMGCHRPDHKGGKIKGTPPDWAPVANLTQDALADWTEAGFVKTLRTGVNPTGSTLRNPMTKTLKYTPHWSDAELKAVWRYLKTVKGTVEL